ncbi:MAG: hypothetical protein AAB391_02440 [Patescibacteria group bacterium]
MRPNKSYTKRLKVTKSGKVLARGKGHNHFNAKERRRSQMKKNRMGAVIMTNKTRARFLGGNAALGR